jgi:hypothetical protein
MRRHLGVAAMTRPAAFMSYAHVDNEGGKPTEFRQRLSAEVRLQTGEEFLIFQDRNDIAWGQNWQAACATGPGASGAVRLTGLEPATSTSGAWRSLRAELQAREG